MKSLSLTVDRLLSNPSFIQVRGKLLLASEDKMRIILELKTKKHVSLFGPFEDVDLAALVNKDVIAFTKEGEPTKVFNTLAIPKQARKPV